MNGGKGKNPRTGPGFCLCQIGVEVREEQILDVAYESRQSPKEVYVILDVKIL